MTPPAMPAIQRTTAPDRRSLLRGLLGTGLMAGLPGSTSWANGMVGPDLAGARSRTLHGVTITDPFGWLDAAALDDPQVVRLMAEFASHSDRVMAPLDGLVEQLRAEADAATPPASLPVPVPDGDHGYWSQWGPGGRQLWRLFCAPHVAHAAPRVAHL